MAGERPSSPEFMEWWAQTNGWRADTGHTHEIWNVALDAWHAALQHAATADAVTREGQPVVDSSLSQDYGINELRTLVIRLALFSNERARALEILDGLAALAAVRGDDGETDDG